MEEVSIRTQEHQAFYDITGKVQSVVRERGVEDGVCVVFSPHTTAGVTLNENWDESVQHDMGLGLNAISPSRSEYRHGEGNSPAHLKTSLIGSSEMIFIEGGELVLGRWQGIYLAEFDGPRSRKVFVKVLAGSA